MKKAILSLAALSLASCAAPVVKDKTFPARVTVYNAHEDKYGSHIAMGGRAHEGVTVAAEHAFAFGTKLTIPAIAGKIGDGHFVVQDRGSAVETRKASHGALPVFDVFVASPRLYRWCKYHLPPVMDVTLE